MKKLTLGVLGLAALALVACERNETTVTAVPAGPSGLVGLKSDAGATTLGASGYVLVRTEGQTSFWWNANTASCLQVIAPEGTIGSVDGVSSDACTVS